MAKGQSQQVDWPIGHWPINQYDLYLYRAC